MKIIKKIKEKDLDVSILILIIVTVLAFYRELNPNDELWNFANIYKMNIGYEIYNDLNVIITPLFFYIGQIFLKLFGNNYFGFTIYNIAIYVALFILILKLFKVLNIKRRRAIIYLLGIIIAFETIIPAGAGYNRLILIPIIATIIMLVKGKNNPYALGIITCITFLTKQNTGIYFLIGILLYEIIEKEKIKNIIKILLTFFILTAVFSICMIMQGNFNQFINYAFLGINEFSKNNTSVIWNFAVYMCVFFFIIAVSIFAMKNKKINLDSKMKKNITILLSIGSLQLLVAYPIFNYSHILLSGLIIIIEFIYLLDQTLISEMFTNRKKEKIIYLTIICIYLIKMGIYIIGYIQSIQVDPAYLITDKNSPYYGVVCSTAMQEEISNVCKFIKENEEKGIDVKIVSYKAELYMLPLQKNNQDFDLPFLGNLGREGEDGLIGQISNLKKTKILIQANKEDVFWQESEKVREYIQSNYKKEGTIADFDIYFIP